MDALKLFRQALRPAGLSCGLSAVFLLSGCLAAANPGDPAEAVRKYERDYLSAVELYKKLISQGRDTGNLRFQLGMLYFGRADFHAAIGEFDKSGDARSKKMSAIAYYNLGDYVEALKIFGENTVSDAQALYYYGLTCEKLNLFDKALENYRKVKSPEFSAKAAERLVVIEKQGGKTLIGELSPETAAAIARAPSAAGYPQAGAQVLLCDEQVRITADNKEISESHYLIKILNERGKDSFSETHIDYDSTYEKVELEFARTIKPDGSVADVGSRHIRDVTKYMNFPLYSNARVFIISFPEIAEGAAVEYKVRIVRNQLVNKKDFVMDYPFQASEPILSAGFTLEVPKGRDVLFKVINEEYNSFKAEPGPRIEQLPDKTIYRWSFRDIPQIIPETGMPPSAEINPGMLISSFRNWKDVYDWWWSLARDKMAPDQAIKEKVRELTAGSASDEEKMRAIYNFCAKDIRYVAVEYGQAGYEPHQAADIFKNKYGDCKDQAILLVTMLNEAGFRARPVLIGTKDTYNLDENFPGMFFDHAIAEVDLGGRPVFLDATAETCSFGDLPPSDQGRKVFACGTDGYKIESIPFYPAGHNLIVQAADIKINEDESITAHKTVQSTGVYDQSQRYWLLYTIPEVVNDQISAKAQEISIGARVESYKIKNLNDLNKPVELSYKFNGPEYLIRGGSLRIMPQVGNLDTSLVSKESRRYPIDFGFPDIKSSELILLLPDNFMIKYIPENVIKDSPWLKFEASYRAEGGKLVFKQKIEVKKNKIVPGEYPAFKAFFEQLAQSLKQRVVLEKKGNRADRIERK